MQILNRTGRTLVVHAKTTELVYPMNVELNVTLGPLDFFGVEPIGSKLRLVPVGREVTYDSTRYSGPGRVKANGSYPLMNFSSSFLGNGFSIQGNIAQFEFSVNKFEQLDRFVHDIDDFFAPLFSVALPVSVEIIEISGTLGGNVFYLSGNFPKSALSFATDEELPMEEFFSEVAPAEFAPSVHMISSMRYLQQAERLASDGFHKTTYLSERLLNLSKALEAIFGDGVDEMKSVLRGFGVAEGYIDVFATVRYLRNQTDIGHVSFTDLAAGQVVRVFDFAELSATCIRSLLRLLMRDREKQEQLYALRTSEAKTKTKDAVSYLKNYDNFLPPENWDLSVLNKKQGLT